MNFFAVFLIAISLAMDAFAVSISNGLALSKVKPMHAVKFGLFFGIFQFIMPLIGYLCSKNFSGAIEEFDHWIAFILLVLIGGKMFIETFKNDDISVANKDEVILSFKNLTVLAIATSIDALAVGVSFAFVGEGKGLGILEASAIIGIVAFVLSFIGAMLGRKIGDLFQKNAERIGGLILIGIGCKILIEHLFL